ncbi:MAG: P1 family peptidase [Candidatus Eremiobacteraeota bacterium]|nr:P1 family peptidase [Candidatus Eremiobacteraeota bacterium]
MLQSHTLCRLVSCLLVATTATFARAETAGIRIGTLPHGPLDAITDVPGVRVGQVTKIEGSGMLRPGIGPVRTGVSVVMPNFNTWYDRVAAATYDLNGNGEMTGTHWINEAGFLEVPITLTNTLDVGRVDDGVVQWMVRHYPKIGIEEDVPLPVVAECDDEALNDIQGRHVTQADVAAALDGARSGPFSRGAVGAGTGMHAFGFKGGIGTASRMLARNLRGYTVGVLTNVNDGSRSELRIDGVPVGRELQNVLRPVYPQGYAMGPRQRGEGGSIIVVVATNAPLDHRQLFELAKRASLGLARTGWNSHISSGDLFIAFSTTRLYPRDTRKATSTFVMSDEDTMDGLFAATAEATEAAVDDALFSAKTMTGINGNTLYAIPIERVRALLENH